jgi:tetratricopeptide (TPR) repeat protein
MKIISLVCLAGLACAGCAPRVVALANDTSRPPYDPTIVSKDIAFHESRVKADPGGALGWSFLAAACLLRSKEIDSTADAQRAEFAARKSLSLRRTGNIGASLRLGSALLQQHRFEDALVVAKDGMAILPDYGPAIQQYAECLVELGRYDEAEAIVHKNIALMNDPPGETLEARLLQIRGQNDKALQLLRAAKVAMESNHAMPRETISWFQVRYAEMLMFMGKADEAEPILQQTLTLYPRNYKAFADLTRISAGKGDWKAVITYGEQSNRIAQMVDIEALVGDAYAQQGDKAKAQAAYDTVRQFAGRPSGGSGSLHDFTSSITAHGHTLDRQYAIFCADHNVDLDSAYGAALRDSQMRRDVYTFDTIAWVCFKRGEQAEAEAAIQKALTYGTKDATMLFHAGMIYSKSKDREKAGPFLNEALAANPYFNAVQVDEAKSILDNAGANAR